MDGLGIGATLRAEPFSSRLAAGDLILSQVSSDVPLIVGGGSIIYSILNQFPSDFHVIACGESIIFRPSAEIVPSQFPK